MFWRQCTGAKRAKPERLLFRPGTVCGMSMQPPLSLLYKSDPLRRKFATPLSQNMFLHLPTRRLRELIRHAILPNEPNPHRCVLRRQSQLAPKSRGSRTCGFMFSHTIFLMLSRDNVTPSLGLIQAPTTSPYL